MFYQTRLNSYTPGAGTGAGAGVDLKVYSDNGDGSNHRVEMASRAPGMPATVTGGDAPSWMSSGVSDRGASSWDSPRAAAPSVTPASGGALALTSARRAAPSEMALHVDEDDQHEDQTAHGGLLISERPPPPPLIEGAVPPAAAPNQFNDTNAPETPAAGSAGEATEGSEEVENWAEAMFDHEAQDHEELSLTTGSLIRVTSTSVSAGEGWWQGVDPATGQEGIFPSAYVETTSRRP